MVELPGLKISVDLRDKVASCVPQPSKNPLIATDLFQAGMCGSCDHVLSTSQTEVGGLFREVTP